MTLTVPVIALVFGLTAIPVEVRPFDLQTISQNARAIDVGANFVGYIPVGVVLAALQLRNAIGAAATLSLICEACQFFMLHRHPSLVDLAFNTGGATAGWHLTRRCQIGASTISLGVGAASIAGLALTAVLAILGFRAWSIWKEADWRGLTVNSRGALSPGSLEAYWTFDELVDGSVPDSSGKRVDGRLVGKATLAEGLRGKAVRLRGGTGYVDFGNSVEIRLMGSLTICAWINSASFPSDDASILSAYFPGYQLDTTVDEGPRTIGFKLVDTCGNLMCCYGKTPLRRNTWYHLAGVYDADSQTMSVYLNGKLDNGSTRGTVTSAQQPSKQRVYVGRRADSEDYGFDGLIDEVQVYSRSLRPEEIDAAMNDGAVPDGGLDSVVLMPARKILEARQSIQYDDCRRATNPQDAWTPGLIVAIGMLSAIAAAGFLPWHRCSSMLFGLGAGLVVWPIAPLILPAYNPWAIPLLSLAGAAATTVALERNQWRT